MWYPGVLRHLSRIIHRFPDPDRPRCVRSGRDGRPSRDPDFRFHLDKDQSQPPRSRTMDIVQGSMLLIETAL